MRFCLVQATEMKLTLFTVKSNSAEDRESTVFFRLIEQTAEKVWSSVED